MFLDEFFEPYYSKLDRDFRTKFLPGQLFQTHVFYAYESLQMWRPTAYDGTETRAVNFEIVTAGEDAFRRQAPLQSPKLEAYEEFPVVRAKRRPVVLIVPDPPAVGERPLRGGGRIDRHVCLVAPCFGVADQLGKSKFPQTFIDRVRKLEFPHFSFLPAAGGPLDRDSLLRFDSIQAVFHNHLEPWQWRLADDVLGTLQGQIRFFTTGLYEGDYATVRELLLSQPSQHA